MDFPKPIGNTRGLMLVPAAFRTLLAVGLLLFSLASCKVIPRQHMLQDVTKDTAFAFTNVQPIEPVVQPDDLLRIVVSSLNPAEDGLYNAAGLESVDANSSGFLVDKDGYIVYRRIGKLLVQGKSLRQVKEILEKQLLPFLKEPIITVSYLNHQVTVIGEVGSAQSINMPSRKMRLFDLLAKASNLTKDANVQTVLLIRETDGKRQATQIDLTKREFLTSPFYFVEPNDVVVVRPNTEFDRQQQRDNRFNRYWSVAVTAINVALLIIFNSRR